MEHRTFREWARSQDRRDIDVPAIGYREDGSRLGLVLSNLSYEGCQLKSNKEFDPGERLTLVVLELGAEVTATIRWCSDGRAGAQFAW